MNGCLKVKKIFPFIAKLLYYPALGCNVMIGKVFGLRDWWSIIDDHVILGAVPFPGDLPVLKKIGIGAVLNLCRECPGDLDLYCQYGMDYMYLPVVDFTSPDLDTVFKGVSFINDRIAHDRKVYVHCRSGRGRSATVVLCWLVREMDLKPEDAMDLLVSKRPHINNRVYKREVVKEFYNKIHSDVSDS